jgi:uncharacterized membrane protein
MGKNRLEAFSDGVIAIIIITIMVLELKVPHGADFSVLLPLWPVFMSYELSFIYVGIYWNKLQYGGYPTKSALRRTDYMSGRVAEGVEVHG